MIHHTEPEGFLPRFTVVGCFLEREGKFLLLHRQSHKPDGDTWGVPAGKVNAGEDVHSAIAREVFEETGFRLPTDCYKHFTKLYVRLKKFDLVYHIFSSSFPVDESVALQLDEHKDFRWVTKSEALGMNLIEDEDLCIQLFYSSTAQV